MYVVYVFRFGSNWICYVLLPIIFLFVSMPPPPSERTWQVVCFPKAFDENGELG
jgi:hypothetical protein